MTPQPAPVAAFTVVSVTLQLEQGGQTREVAIAAAFDKVTTQDAARTVGREIGQALGDNLCQKLQHGEALT
jgi:acid phosphatase family membrane protein YuiD